MAKIKIISNPYQKETIFQNWDEVSEHWCAIDAEYNENSKLLCDELRVGFFPFKAKQIIDAIISEYSTSGEKVEVVFEGTDDEYLELASICGQEDYSALIALSKSGRYLENARDILPDVIDVFKELNPLVAESVSDKEKIKRELEKFSDASNDVIPICVIGNYSSGKSTFINALIGYELLPSSDEPTTAKIYKISQSKHPDRAAVKFEYGPDSVRIRFNADSYKFLTDPAKNPLVVRLTEILDKIAAESIPFKLSKVLETINGFANHEKDEEISDLIEIETPFDDDGLWGSIWNNFIIFDTPGSNSASNIKHYQVLKTALEGLSNGLPIFVSEYDSLDSMDNDRLYQDINNMTELDNRFTMIIVNKADAASLKKTGLTDDDRDRILNLAIPRQLYSGGIYFVSSIVGLGSKNDEEFIGEHNAEIFEDQKNKYANPTSRFYKQLYHYNILPAQIKLKYDMRSDKHKNLLYANSGLYSVEQAIETFAGVYSHYNKCQQSQLFLNKVIQITFNEITDVKKEKEARCKRIHAKLEKEKQVLIDKLETYGVKAEASYRSDYSSAMKECVAAATTAYTSSELTALESSFRQAKAAEKDVEGHREDVLESARSFVDNLGKNFANTFRERNLSALKKIGTDFTEGFKDIFDNYNELAETKKDAEQASSDALISTIRDEFTTNIAKAQSALEDCSRTYWAERTEQLKTALSQIVTDSSALSEEKRTELSGVILKYQELVFDTRVESIFDKAAFLHRFFGDSNRLNIDKLTRKYNSEMQTQVLTIYRSFEISHANSFDSWMHQLLATITENIVEFNPQLHDQAEVIREETERIAELESRKIKLTDYTEQIKRMMDWKES